ncbi:MAG: hypothetical protein LBR55_07275, partial [Bacteroidales bacterium]|nr:hypothetical protein [Bacteroidales bacterium]
MKKKLWAFCVCLYSICCLPLASNAQTLPTNIQGLMAWFSADSLKLPADASVDVWNNNNPNYSCTLSQSDTRFCPKFIENALNAKPLVRFNGSNNYLNGGNTLNMGSEGQSIFIVAKSNANTGTLLAKSANGTSQYSQNKYALRCTTNNRIFFEYIDDKTYLITPEETLSNYSLFTSTVDLKEGIIAFFVNSKKVSENFTQQNHVFNSTFDFLVGAYNNANGSIPPTAYLNGDIAEIIIYNRAVTQQERQAIENYLRLKYFPGTERLPFSLGEDTYQPYSLQNLALEVPDKPYFTSITWNTGETTRSVTAEKPGIYSVQVVDDWGYEYYDTIVFAKPDIHQLRDTILCIGDTLTWDCGIAGDYSYSWNTGANTQSIEIYEPGDYWVEITDTLHNTARSTMIHVTVDNFSAEASLGNDAELCAGNYIELVSGDTTSIVSYLWNTGVTSSRLQVSETGTYWLKATNANNCIAHDTISVEINGIAPFANFIASNECVNQTTILQQNSTTTDGSHIIRAEWKIGNETFDGLTHEHIFTTCGEQTVQLQVTSSSGCNASIQKMLYINPVAQVSFSPLTACQHVAVTFQPTVSIESGSIDRYEWKIADETIVAQTIKKIFSTAGEFPVSLEVTSDKGCKNSAQNSIL